MFESSSLETVGASIPKDLEQAMGRWCRQGDPERLRRLFRLELDDDGIPRHWPVSTWMPSLSRLAELRRSGPKPWPADLDETIQHWSQAVARWIRPDRSWAFDPSSTKRPRPVGFFKTETGLNPSHICPDRVLGVLRSDWGSKADQFAFDHRQRSEPCRFDWVAGGTWWLGPAWVSSLEGSNRGPIRVDHRTDQNEVQALEWSFRCELGRLRRTLVWLPTPRLALLAEQWDSPVASKVVEAESRIGLAPGVVAERLSGARALRLTKGPRASALAIPLALPAQPYPTERGTLEAERETIVLRQRRTGRRTWMPLLLSWNPSRHRRAVHWRVLTVSEQGRICAPEAAFGVRVSWGRDEQYLIYRSLARPALRAVLGHQTQARFLFGRFDRNGNVEPILKVD